LMTIAAFGDAEGCRNIEYKITDRSDRDNPLDECEIFHRCILPCHKIPYRKKRFENFRLFLID
jgi:hypothetical protein